MALAGEVNHSYRRGPAGAGNFGRASTGRVQFTGRPRKKLNFFQKLFK